MVIGGGVLGCASALELRAAGYEVTLIERARIGSEATWAGAGLLSALLPWNYRPEVLNLLEWSRALYPAWLASLASGVDVEYRQSGLLILPPYNGMAAQAWANEYKQALTQLVARDIEPGTESEDAALWLPDVAQVRNPRLIQALRDTLTQRGIHLCEETAVLGWDKKDKRISAALSAQGSFQADYFVLAAGAWSSGLLPAIVTPDVKPMRGQIIVYKDAPERLRTMVYRDGFYVIPRLDGHILVGSTLEDVGFDKHVTPEARRLLMQKAGDMLPWLKSAHPVAHWAGLRPAAPDNIPFIGRHPELENLYINTGHYRYGVTMAPASARLLTELMEGKSPSIDPKPYALTRAQTADFKY